MNTHVDYIPDAIFPSDNAYEIPTLDPSMQAEFIEAPVKIWGNQTRHQKFAGTWAFYCKDYKFTALWKHPDTLLKTACSVVVEPNFSTSPDMPNAVALYGIFRKRWLARFWQMHGVRVIVDLCVAEKFLDLNLCGVPDGWSSFATRVMKGYHHLIQTSYEVACQKAGGKPKLFLVYGGNQQTRQRCQDNGWLWIPEQMQIVREDMAGKSRQQ
jgi:hypothetical protein